MSRKDLGESPIIEGGTLAREAVSIALTFEGPRKDEDSAKVVKIVEEICLHHGRAVGAISFLVEMLVVTLQGFIDDPNMYLQVMWQGMAESDMGQVEIEVAMMEELRNRIDEQPNKGGWDDHFSQKDDDGEEE